MRSRECKYIAAIAVGLPLQNACPRFASDHYLIVGNGWRERMPARVYLALVLVRPSECIGK
jgi:hypothetical protein